MPFLTEGGEQKRVVSSSVQVQLNHNKIKTHFFFYQSSGHAFHKSRFLFFYSTPMPTWSEKSRIQFSFSPNPSPPKQKIKYPLQLWLVGNIFFPHLVPLLVRKPNLEPWMFRIWPCEAPALPPFVSYGGPGRVGPRLGFKGLRVFSQTHLWGYLWD